MLMGKAEKGKVPEDRKQWAVDVSGFLEDFDNGKETEWICECILAPKVIGGRGKRPPFCKRGCKVKVRQRTYHDCSRREVLEELIDFDSKYSYPRAILDADEMDGVSEYEKSRDSQKKPSK